MHIFPLCLSCQPIKFLAHQRHKTQTLTEFPRAVRLRVTGRVAFLGRNTILLDVTCCFFPKNTGEHNLIQSPPLICTCGKIDEEQLNGSCKYTFTLTHLQPFRRKRSYIFTSIYFHLLHSPVSPSSPQSTKNARQSANDIRIIAILVHLHVSSVGTPQTRHSNGGMSACNFSRWFQSL